MARHGTGGVETGSECFSDVCPFATRGAGGAARGPVRTARAARARDRGAAGALCRMGRLHCNFLGWHFQPFSLNLVPPSVVKPSGEIAERGKRHPT